LICDRGPSLDSRSVCPAVHHVLRASILKDAGRRARVGVSHIGKNDTSCSSSKNASRLPIIAARCMCECTGSGSEATPMPEHNSSRKNHPETGHWRSNFGIESTQAVAFPRLSTVMMPRSSQNVDGDFGPTDGWGHRVKLESCSDAAPHPSSRRPCLNPNCRRF
jgi:hypothetical protein